MAKRKSAGTGGRSRAAGRSSKATTGRKKTARKQAARKSAKKAASKKTVARKAKARKPVAATRAVSRGKKRAAPAPARRPIAAAKKTKKAPAAPSRKAVSKKTAASKKVVASKAIPARRRAATPPPAVARKTPALNRTRRTVPDDDVVPTPPSSLDLDRTASAARSGRRGLRDKFDEHTNTGPDLTGGDVDADWESAYSVGDEAPGGDNPTPDQDIVDDIGRAVGVEYQDNEELKGDEKIADRDRHRWELDPASAEDYDEH